MIVITVNWLHYHKAMEGGGEGGGFNSDLKNKWLSDKQGIQFISGLEPDTRVESVLVIIILILF